MKFNQYKTKNGTTIYSYNMPNAKVFHVDFMFPYIGMTLPNKYSQAVHLMKHVLSSASDELKLHGGYVNARTGYCAVEFYVTLPIEYLLGTVDMYLDSLFASEINDNICEREKGAVRAELAGRSKRPQPRSLSFINSLTSNSTLEKKNGAESLANIDSGMIKSLRCGIIKPDNLVVFVAGNIEPDLDKIIDKIEKIAPVVSPTTKLMIPLKVYDLNNLPYINNENDFSSDEAVYFNWLHVTGGASNAERCTGL